MKIAKMALVFIATALSLALLGCSGETTGTNAAAEKEVSTESIDAEAIIVKQQGFNVDSEGNVSYAFIVNNPNNGYIARSVVFSLQGFDDKGNMVLGSSESIEALYPGVDTALVGSTYISGTGGLSRLDITPSMELMQWSPTEFTADQIDGMFSMVNTRNSRDVNGDVAVSGGVVANDLAQIAACEGVPEDQVSATLTIVLVGADGNMIGGTTVKDLNFSGDVGVVHETESMGNSAQSKAEAIEESAEGEVLKCAEFSVAIPNIPGYRECLFFALPS